MKKLIFFIFSILFTYKLSIAAGNLTDFILGAGGARPISMGSAFVSISDDVNAILWNSAGLVYVRNRQFSSMHKSLSGWDTRIDSLSFIMPFTERIGIGFGYLHTSISGIVFTEPFLDRYKIIGRGGVSYVGYAMGMGYRLNETTNLGITGKYYHQDLAGFGTTSVVSFDFGSIYEYRNRLKFGFSLQNLYLVSGEDHPPFRIRFGSAYNDIIAETHPIVFSTELEKEKRRPVKHKLGIEYSMSPLLKTRLGFKAGNITAGIGLNTSKIKVDYAFEKAENEFFDDSHFLSATYVFEEERKVERKKIPPKEKKDFGKEPIRKTGERIEKVIDELEKIKIPEKIEELQKEEEDERPLYQKWQIPSIRDFKEEPLRKEEKVEVKIERLKDSAKKEERYILKSKKFIEVIERKTSPEKKEKIINLEKQEKKSPLKILLLNGKEVETFGEKEIDLEISCKEIKERGFNNKIIIDVMKMRDSEIQKFVETLKVNPIDYWALLNIGRSLLERGELTKAIDIINNAIYYYPDEARGYNLRGCAYLLNECFAEAEEEFIKSISNDSSYINPYNNLAVLYVYKYNDYRKAYDIINKIFEKNRKEKDSIIKENLNKIIEKLR